MNNNVSRKLIIKAIIPVLLLIAIVISFDLLFPPVAISNLSYGNIKYKLLTDFFDVIILILFLFSVYQNTCFGLVVIAGI